MGSKESLMTPQGGLGRIRERSGGTRGSASDYGECTTEAEAEAPSAASDYGECTTEAEADAPSAASES